jgi:hypothetical protein
MNEISEKWSIILFIGTLLILLIGGLLFFDIVMPVILPMLSWKLWLFELASGMCLGPLILLLGFASLLAFGKERVNWNATVIGSIVGLVSSVLYISGLAFLFSSLLSSTFEPFRSVTLPILIWAFTFYFVSRTRAGDWLRRISSVKQ